MIAGDETRRLILILGSEGTALDHQQVGWFFPDRIGTEAVYKIEGARLEIARNARGYAEPIKEPENGCVVVDASGAAWIRTIDQNTRVSFNLATGVAGSPAGQVCDYRDWQLVWTPAGETEPGRLNHARSDCYGSPNFCCWRGLIPASVGSGSMRSGWPAGC